MPAIQTQKLTKIYRRSHLGKLFLSPGVKNLTLEVKQGEIFGLLGLNGSGKTTTIKLLLGLLTPSEGSVSILNEKMPNINVLKQIGYIPETPYFYKYLTAKEILGFYANLSDINNSEKRVDEILDIVGLWESRNRRLSEFSKGMLQRIGIAQSILHDPQILVYDEPVSGLDPLAISQMRNLLLNLKTKQKTIFLSSHLISEVEKICDRVGILSKGELVRVIEQKEWQAKDGGLEKIFVSAVSDSSEVSNIKL
jgi:ABC-2 type transport system ATP-binding protein